MLSSIMGGIYGLTVLGVGYNIAKIRLNDDFHYDIKQWREYDFTYEKIDPHSLPRKSIVHVKLDNNEHNDKFIIPQKIPNDEQLAGDGEELKVKEVYSIIYYLIQF